MQVWVRLGVGVTEGVRVPVAVGIAVGDGVPLGVLVIVGDPTVLVMVGVVVPFLTVMSTQKD